MAVGGSFIGRALGGYRIERLIGSGAVGTVYVGRGADDSVRAIKVLTLPSPIFAGEADEFRRRFVRESQAMRSLRHPNILFVEAFGEDVATGTLYMVMPYIATGTLETQLTAPQPFHVALGYLYQIGAAIDFANDLGFIHRDIKPSNILITADDQLKVTDFGIVKLFETDIGDRTTIGTVLGTPNYMAPEQARGVSVTRAADVYSVGMVGYHLLTGVPAFQGSSIIEVLLQVENAEPPSPSTLRTDLPEAAAQVLLNCLAKDPARRYTTALKFVTSLELALRPEATYAQNLMGPTLGISPSQPRGRRSAPLPAPGLASSPIPASSYTPPAQSAPFPYALPLPLPLPVPTINSGQMTPRRQAPWPFIVSVVALVVIAASVLGIVLSRPHGSATTATTSPTASHTFSYMAPVPGTCGENTGWQNGSSMQAGNVDLGYDCSTTGLTMYGTNTIIGTQNPISEVFWKNPLPEQNFTTSITVSKLNNGCAGIGINDNLTGYIAFTCETGQWYLKQYDATGKPVTPDPGQGSLAKKSSNTVTLQVTSSTLTLSIDGGVIKQITRASGIRASTIALAYFSTILRSSCLLTNFTFDMTSTSK